MRALVAVVGVVCATTMLAILPAPAAVAQEFHRPSSAVERRPAIARFDGQKLDMARGWGEAKACLAWRQAGVLDCFHNRQQLETRAAELSGLLGGFSCGTPLKLFGDSGLGGRELWFYDRGYRQNLGDYGLDNQLSSYAVGACYAHLAENGYGRTTGIPGTQAHGAVEATMKSSPERQGVLDCAGLTQRSLMASVAREPRCGRCPRGRELRHAAHERIREA